MKNILLIILFPLHCLSQGLDQDDCGTWEIDTTYQLVVSTDTIKYIPWGSSEWIYGTWEVGYSGMTLAVYCPCGCGHSTSKSINRINGKGIIQTVEEITRYKYIPKPETEYHRKLK